MLAAQRTLASAVGMVEGVLRTPELDANARRLTPQQADGRVRHGELGALINEAELQLVVRDKARLLGGQLSLAQVSASGQCVVDGAELAPRLPHCAERWQRIEPRDDDWGRRPGEGDRPDDFVAQPDRVPYVHLTFRELCRWLTPELSCGRVK